MTIESYWRDRRVHGWKGLLIAVFVLANVPLILTLCGIAVGIRLAAAAIRRK